MGRSADVHDVNCSNRFAVSRHFPLPEIDRRALVALQAKVKEGIGASEIADGHITFAPFDTEKEILRQIEKLVPDCLTNFHVGLWLYFAMNRVILPHISDKAAVGQTVGQRADASIIEEVADSFVSWVKSLPHTYYFYFPFPGLTALGESEVRVADNVKLIDTTGQADIDGLAVISPSELPLGDAIADDKAYLHPDQRYLKVTAQGYCYGNDIKQAAPERALSIAKQFVVFGVADNALDEEYTAQRTLLPAVYVEQQKPEKKGRIEIPQAVLGRFEVHIFNESQFAKNALANLLTYLPSKKATTESNGKERAARIEKRLERVSRILAAPNDSEDAKALRATAEWYFDSRAEANDTIAFMQMGIGFEALFGEQSEEESTRSIIASRLSFAIGKGRPNRRDIAKEFCKLYKLRSKIVHGRTSRLSTPERDFLHWGQARLLEAIKSEIQWI